MPRSPASTLIGGARNGCHRGAQQRRDGFPSSDQGCCGSTNKRSATWWAMTCRNDILAPRDAQGHELRLSVLPQGDCSTTNSARAARARNSIRHAEARFRMWRRSECAFIRASSSRPTTGTTFSSRSTAHGTAAKKTGFNVSRVGSGRQWPAREVRAVRQRILQVKATGDDRSM